MIVTPIKTNLIKEGDYLFEIISKNIKKLSEKSILVIAAKIISICQSRAVEKRTDNKIRAQKHKLIQKEAGCYLDILESKYGVMLTIKNNILGINAGINESNANDKYILLPKNVQDVTNSVWSFLRKQYSIKKTGVIIADSTILPLRWGSIGVTVSYCGFKPLYKYHNERDIFGKRLSFSQVNIVDALAIAAVSEMGEAGEQQPFCLIEEVSNKIIFQNKPPNQKELKEFLIDIKNDPFFPILSKANWKKGREGL